MKESGNRSSKKRFRMRHFATLVVEASGVETLFPETIFSETLRLKRFFYPPITRFLLY